MLLHRVAPEARGSNGLCLNLFDLKAAARSELISISQPSEGIPTSQVSGKVDQAPGAVKLQLVGSHS